MIKKTVNYEDFDGNKRTEDLYFNLTKFEATEFALDLPDDITNEVTKEGVDATNMESVSRIVQKLGGKGIIDFIRKLVLKSYGIKSEDGRRFEKSEKISTEFSQTMAFDNLMMELLTDDDEAAKFINGVIPADLANAANGAMLPGA
jgi:hypothetical protein|nr:MAG TPA: hypothetical protein [Caudoviricetes sp.]